MTYLFRGEFDDPEMIIIPMEPHTASVEDEIDNSITHL